MTSWIPGTRAPLLGSKSGSVTPLWLWGSCEWREERFLPFNLSCPGRGFRQRVENWANGLQSHTGMSDISIPAVTQSPRSLGLSSGCHDKGWGCRPGSSSGGGRQLNHVLGLAHHWFPHHSKHFVVLTPVPVAGTVRVVVMKNPGLREAYSQLGEKMSQLIPKDAWWMLRICAMGFRGHLNQRRPGRCMTELSSASWCKLGGRRGMGIPGREDSTN